MVPSSRLKTIATSKQDPWVETPSASQITEVDVLSRNGLDAMVSQERTPHDHIKSIPLLWYVPEPSWVDYVYARVILGYAQAPNDVSFCENMLLRSIWLHKHSGS
jgi:hypothetical protein